MYKRQVFDKLKNSSGIPYQVSDFVVYLNKGFAPYDGTQSIAPLSVLGSPQNGQVKDDFLVNGTPDPLTDAATQIGRTPLTVFLNPFNFDTVGFGANPGNMAVVFHEGLHGFTGMSDVQIQGALGCTVHPPPVEKSRNITDYVEQVLYLSLIHI